MPPLNIGDLMTNFLFQCVGYVIPFGLATYLLKFLVVNIFTCKGPKLSLGHYISALVILLLNRDLNSWAKLLHYFIYSVGALLYLLTLEKTELFLTLSFINLDKTPFCRD